MKRKCIGLVLALVLVLLCSGCGKAPASSTEPPSSSSSGTLPDDTGREQYDAQRRSLSLDPGPFSILHTKVADNVFRQPGYNGQRISTAPLPEVSAACRSGILYAWKNVLCLLNEEGKTACYVARVGEQQAITAIGGADANVVYYQVTGDEGRENYIYRAYLPENVCTPVLDMADKRLQTLLTEFRAEIESWTAVTNRDIVFVLRPMAGTEEDSDAYRAFLAAERDRLRDHPAAQALLQAMLDGSEPESYRPVVVYDWCADTFTLLITRGEQKTYIENISHVLWPMDSNVEIVPQPPLPAAPVIPEEPDDTTSSEDETFVAPPVDQSVLPKLRPDQVHGIEALTHTLTQHGYIDRSGTFHLSPAAKAYWAEVGTDKRVITMARLDGLQGVRSISGTQQTHAYLVMRSGKVNVMCHESMRYDYSIRLAKTLTSIEAIAGGWTYSAEPVANSLIPLDFGADGSAEIVKNGWWSHSGRTGAAQIAIDDYYGSVVLQSDGTVMISDNMLNPKWYVISEDIRATWYQITQIASNGNSGNLMMGLRQDGTLLTAVLDIGYRPKPIPAEYTTNVYRIFDVTSVSDYDGAYIQLKDGRIYGVQGGRELGTFPKMDQIISEPYWSDKTYRQELYVVGVDTQGRVHCLSGDKKDLPADSWAAWACSLTDVKTAWGGK